ncbi:MAG: hypothetical protein ACPGJU_09640, partial [Coraliomargarita sp.]
SLKDSASSAIFAVNYTYEPSTGRLATVSDGTDTFTYAYNSRSEVLGSTNDVVTSAEFVPTYSEHKKARGAHSAGLKMEPPVRIELTT